MSQDYSNTKSVGGRDLRDFALARQTELTRILAGCACVDPPLVVELVRKLKPADLTDESARRFLTAITPDGDPLTVARDLGLTADYPRWLGIACDELVNLRQTARAACDEIRRLTIMREAIAELGTWLAVAQAVGRYA